MQRLAVSKHTTDVPRRFPAGTVVYNDVREPEVHSCPVDPMASYSVFYLIFTMLQIQLSIISEMDLYNGTKPIRPTHNTKKARAIKRIQCIYKSVAKS